MTMTNTMMYEEDDDYNGNYASRPPKSVRMTSDSSSIASSVTGTTTIVSKAQQQIVPLPSPLPRAHNINDNNDGVLRLTEGFIDDLCLGIEHDLLGKTEDVEILLQLFPSLFDDDDTSSYGQTNTILYECYSTKQHTNKSNDSDSETELDDISDWSSVVTTSPSNNDEGDDDDDDDDDDNPGITLEEEEEEEEEDKNSRALFIAIQTSQDGIEIHENNKSNEDSKPVIKLGDEEENIDTYYNNLELTVQTSESEDRIEVQSAFDDDDDDNDDDNDKMKENNNKKEMYEKEYCCDNNEKEDMERNCSTFTHDDALISLEVPDDELFVLDIASNIDDNDNDDNCTNEKREETKKDRRRKKPDPPSIVSNDGNGNHQRNSNNDPPAITDMHNDPINVGPVFSSAIANLITTSTKTSSSTTLNNEQNESSESMLTDEVITMLTDTTEEEQSSILTDELITLVNKNINSNNNNIELLTTTVANDCEREGKEEIMTFNNNDDPPSPLWLGDDTATTLSEDTTVVSAVTGQHCNDDDNQEYDDDEDSESFQLSVILNETIPKDAVNASNDQWTDESITNTEENVIHTTPSGVRIDNYDCIPTRSSFFQSYDDEPNKKKNDDTDTDTIEIDLNVKKIMSPGDNDNNNNNVEALATTSEAKIRSINGAIVACATLDLANNKFVINDDCNSFSGDVGVESKTTSANDVAILRQPSVLREEESDALKDTNQAFLSSFDKRNSEIHYSTEAVYYGTMDELSCDSTITTRATDRKAESSGINRVIISVGMNESDAKVKRSRFLKRIKKRLFKLSSRGGRSSSNNNNSKSCWHEHEDSVTGKHYYSNGKISTWKRPAKELILAY